MNVIEMGDIGTGKTRSLKTLLPIFYDEVGNEQRGAGQEVFVISVEPGLEATLGDHLCGFADETMLPHPIHWIYLPPIGVDWATVKQYILLANSLRMDDLMKTSDPRKSEYNQFLNLFAVVENFVCSGCDRNFGDAREWGPNATQCIDTLTGLTEIASQCIVGGKPFRSLPETGTIMRAIELFIGLWFSNTKCNCILTTHIDSEISPIDGVKSLTVHTIGQKLAPRLVKMPDEIILCDMDERGYYWCTQRQGVILKSRHIPNQPRIEANFRSLFSHGTDS